MRNTPPNRMGCAEEERTALVAQRGLEPPANGLGSAALPIELMGQRSWCLGAAVGVHEPSLYRLTSSAGRKTWLQTPTIAGHLTRVRFLCQDFGLLLGLIQLMLHVVNNFYRRLSRKLRVQ